MGASFVDRSYKGKLTRDQIKKEFDAQVIEDRDYNGHQEGYSGDWQTLNGVRLDDDVIFANERDASEYVADHSDKWEHAVAVYFHEKVSTKTSAKASDQLKKAREGLRTTKFEIAEMIKNAKSVTIACKNCKSKITRKFLRDSNCPVCSSDLKSVTQNKRIARMNEKVDSIERKLRESMKKGKINTLIGGWCAE